MVTSWKERRNLNIVEREFWKLISKGDNLPNVVSLSQEILNKKTFSGLINVRICWQYSLTVTNQFCHLNFLNSEGLVTMKNKEIKYLCKNIEICLWASFFNKNKKNIDYSSIHYFNMYLLRNSICQMRSL